MLKLRIFYKTILNRSNDYTKNKLHIRSFILKYPGSKAIVCAFVTIACSEQFGKHLLHNIPQRRCTFSKGATPPPPMRLPRRTLIGEQDPNLNKKYWKHLGGQFL